MSSLLDELDGPEAILLMYSAGELSAEDQAEVGRRLARDAAWRAELESLRAGHAAVMSGVGQLPAPPLGASREAAAVRRVGLAMRQRQAESARPGRPSGRRISSGWKVGLSAVAALLVVGVVLFPGGRQPVVESHAELDHAIQWAAADTLASGLNLNLGPRDEQIKFHTDGTSAANGLGTDDSGQPAGGGEDGAMASAGPFLDESGPVFEFPPEALEQFIP